MLEEVQCVVSRAYSYAIGQHQNAPQICHAISVAVLSRFEPKQQGEVALQRCRTCVHGIYEPYSRKEGWRIPDHLARIRCTEGIIGMPNDKQEPTFTWWIYIGAFKRPQSRVRDAVLTCEFWEPKPCPQ